MKKISVIIPCYNVQRYIDRCMHSIVNQTIGMGQLEVILVNDASTDDTLEYLCAWEKLYPDSVLVIHCEENGKQGQARNIGMQYASGEYIIFVDADDWLVLSCIEEMLSVALQYGSDIVCCDYDKVTVCSGGEDGRNEIMYSEVIHYNVQDREIRKRYIGTHVQKTAVWGKLYLRDFIEKSQLSFPVGISYEDTYFSYMAYMMAESISDYQKVLYHYFRNPTGTVVSSSEEKNKERLISLRMFYNQCRRNDWLQEYYQEIEWIFIRKYYVEMMEVMFRTFEKVDYIVYLGLKKWLITCFPRFHDNPYLQGELSELDNIFIRCIQENFNEEQIGIMRTAFLKIIYHKEELVDFAKKEMKEFLYPAKEEILEKIERGENSESVIQLLSMDIEEILKKQNELSEREIVEAYRYVIERECALAYIQECASGELVRGASEKLLCQEILSHERMIAICEKYTVL